VSYIRIDGTTYEVQKSVPDLVKLAEFDHLGPVRLTGLRRDADNESHPFDLWVNLSKVAAFHE
jgi:hypothetical protein